MLESNQPCHAPNVTDDPASSSLIKKIFKEHLEDYFMLLDFAINVGLLEWHPHNEYRCSLKIFIGTPTENRTPIARVKVGVPTLRR